MFVSTCVTKWKTPYIIKITKQIVNCFKARYLRYLMRFVKFTQKKKIRITVRICVIVKF